ncbi:hypothetical protein BHM03_00039999 [Ensete ventricosum]|nr:hypothetical protein BHM03_00039999 [Ensete ventricosum]
MVIKYACSMVRLKLERRTAGHGYLPPFGINLAEAQVGPYTFALALAGGAVRKKKSSRLKTKVLTAEAARALLSNPNRPRACWDHAVPFRRPSRQGQANVTAKGILVVHGNVRAISVKLVVQKIRCCNFCQKDLGGVKEEGQGRGELLRELIRMAPSLAGQFGDTTYTKIFVGGLAWETQSDTVRQHFEQFGEILEAVVITDKNTGRSKGYGFVTFREPAAATRACVDPSPVIDGRRANCNLASLGAQRSRPTTPPYAFPSPASFPHYAIQHGATAQYPVYGAAAGIMTGNAAFYPYFQFGQGNGGAATATAATALASGHGYSVAYPPVLHYSAVASTTGLAGLVQHFGGPLSIAPTPPAHAGMTMALTAPALSSPATYPHRLIPAPFSASTSPEQPLA